MTHERSDQLQDIHIIGLAMTAYLKALPDTVSDICNREKITDALKFLKDIARCDLTEEWPRLIAILDNLIGRVEKEPEQVKFQSADLVELDFNRSKHIAVSQFCFVSRFDENLVVFPIAKN